MIDDPTQYNERARLIGIISFQWAYLEYLVSNVVWHLLGIEKEKGVIVTGHLDIKPELAVAMELADYSGSSSELKGALKQLSKNLDSAEGLASRRNLIVHGIYSSRPQDPTVMIEAHKSKRRRQRQPMTLEYLQETLANMNAAVNHMVEVLESEGINVH